MKNLFLALILIFSNYQIIAQANQKAIYYNDAIVEEQDKIGKKIIAFNNLVADQSSTKSQAESSLKEILTTVDASITAVEKLGAFDGDNKLQKAAIDLFKYYKKCMSTDYVSMIDIVYKASPTEADYAELDTIMKKVTEEEKKYDDSFQVAQEAYAKKNNFTIPGNELKEEIDK